MDKGVGVGYPGLIGLHPFQPRIASIWIQGSPRRDFQPFAREDCALAHSIPISDVDFEHGFPFEPGFN